MCDPYLHPPRCVPIPHTLPIPSLSGPLSRTAATSPCSRCLFHETKGLESEYDNLRDLGLYAGLYILGGMSFGILIQTLIESGHSSTQGNRHHHAMGVMGGDACVSAQDRSMPRSLTPEGDKAAKAPREWSSSLQQQQQQADMIESPPDVTQRPIPTEMSPDNLRALITSRKGRSLLDVKDLQPVCWNIVASDLVRVPIVFVRLRSYVRACVLAGVVRDRWRGLFVVPSCFL